MGFFGAELRRKMEGKTPKTEMSREVIAQHLREWGRKQRAKKARSKRVA